MEGKEIFGTKYGENSIRSDCRLKTQGMSDLFMHECVDISWDDYFLNDDRIVPHHGSKRLNDNFIPGEHNKRCRHELVSSTNNTGGSANKYVDHGNEIPPPLSNTRNTMLEKDTWSHKEASSLACESSSELVKPDMIDFPISDVNHTSNGIFGNAENKDSNDLLYSAWSEVENFDDIERMFRTDPTLGLGISKEDEMSWLSSADDIGGSGDALNSDAKFPTPDVKTISNNHESYSCLENPVSNIHSRDSHLSCDSYPSIVKSEAPIFSTDSGQMEYMDGFAGPPFKETGLVVSGQRGEPQSCQGTHDSLLNRRGVIQTRMSTSGSVATYENHYDSQESSLANASEIDSSNMQEHSTIVPDLDDISLEAASFRQLQLVAKQLDLRTKICIRDSLYRLAHSAEQRRCNPNLYNTFGDEREAAGGASKAEGTKSFMDIETDTNPIDRSVAHLLFNRPSDSSTNIGSA